MVCPIPPHQKNKNKFCRSFFYKDSTISQSDFYFSGSFYTCVARPINN